MVQRARGVLVVPTVSNVIVVLDVPIILIVRVETVVLVLPTLHNMCVCGLGLMCSKCKAW